MTSIQSTPTPRRHDWNSLLSDVHGAMPIERDQDGHYVYVLLPGQAVAVAGATVCVGLSALVSGSDSLPMQTHACVSVCVHKYNSRNPLLAHVCLWYHGDV